MASWGNQTGQQFVQDMESPLGYHLYATKNNADDAAIKGSNSLGLAVHADGSLKVDGYSILNGTTAITTDGPTTLSVTNDFATGMGIDVAGKVRVTNEAPAAALEAINNYNALDAYALKVSGKIYSTYGGSHTAVKIEHTDADELALEVSGKAQIRGTIASPFHVLNVINDGAGGAIRCGGPFTSIGAVDIDNTLDLDADTTGVAMDVYNTNTGQNATAIKAAGPIALDARGHIGMAEGKKFALDGTAGQNYITYNANQSRLEFFIGGTLRFIIDSTGGHNP